MTYLHSVPEGKNGIPIFVLKRCVSGTSFPASNSHDNTVSMRYISVRGSDDFSDGRLRCVTIRSGWVSSVSRLRFPGEPKPLRRRTGSATRNNRRYGGSRGATTTSPELSKTAIQIRIRKAETRGEDRTSLLLRSLYQKRR